MLYHKDIGIPNTLQWPAVGIRLEYGHHAQDKATELNLDLPARLPAYTLIELECNLSDIVTKWVIRFSYDKFRDMVLVVQPDRFVRTVWLNDVRDTHRTLNRAAYTVPRA